MNMKDMPDPFSQDTVNDTQRNDEAIQCISNPLVKCAQADDTLLIACHNGKSTQVERRTRSLRGARPPVTHGFILAIWVL